MSWKSWPIDQWSTFLTSNPSDGVICGRSIAPWYWGCINRRWWWRVCFSICYGVCSGAVLTLEVAGEEPVVSLMCIGANAVFFCDSASCCICDEHTFPCWSWKNSVKYSLDHHPVRTTTPLCCFDLELKVFMGRLTAVVPTYSPEKFSWSERVEGRDFSVPV